MIVIMESIQASVFSMLMILLLFVYPAPPFAIACAPNERTYLLDFKFDVVDMSHSLTSWRGMNCCEWEGVACAFHSHQPHVTALNLRKFNLSGDVHSSLFKLKHLEHLDLSWNSFPAIPIPSDVGKLKRLSFLGLSYAGFGGEIPLTLSNLTNLRFLHLASGYPLQLQSGRLASWLKSLIRLEYLSLDGTIVSSATTAECSEALSTLSKLRHLSMKRCWQRGQIPNSLVNLTSLVHLDLSGNYLSGQIPGWFENVTSRLLLLDLSGNDLDGPVPSNLLHSAHRLQELDLSSNIDLRGDVLFIAEPMSSSLISIHLSATSVEGEIPSTIGNMSSLKYLQISHMNLKGVIPPSIGNLSKLVHLYLGSNSLTGSIPSSLGRLSTLVYLALDNNQLNGTIPSTVFKLVHLKELFVSFNSLTGTISLSLLDNLTRLQVLQLSHNHFSVKISSTWNPMFDKLQILGLASCNLQTFPSFLVSQYYLQGLDLSTNSIAENIPTWIWDLPNLGFLNLSCNQLTGSLPRRLTPDTLMLIDLHNNSLQGSLPLPPPGVFELDLSRNQFNGSIPSDIATCVDSAWFFSLSNNNISGAIPETMCSTFMIVLDLSKNLLRNTIPPNFPGNCLALRVLNLAENHLQGSLPALKNLTKLEALIINGNNMQGDIPPSIANCSFLKVLDLGNNNLEGTIPKWIGNLSQLEILMLRSNKLQGNILPETLELSSLQVLDLSHNLLSGPIPTRFTHLHAIVNGSQSSSKELSHDIGYPYQMTVATKGLLLEYEIVLSIFKLIDLSCNNLSGSIPPDIGYLQGLKVLNLSKNHLNGKIPPTLENMIQLESLDLSENKLEGNIPLNLAKLYYLEYLNLSYNMLEGRVPRGEQFETFGESSYLGNTNLSGIPFTNTSPSRSSPQNGNGSGDNNFAHRQEPTDSKVETEWWGAAMGLSYGLGFSIVIGLLYFNKRMRKVAFVSYDTIIVVMFNDR